LEYLTASLRYLLHYSQKYGIRLPDEDKLVEMMDKTLSILYKSPTQNQHDFKHSDDSTDVPLEQKFFNGIYATLKIFDKDLKDKPDSIENRIFQIPALVHDTEYTSTKDENT
jgi:hypothetical protein